MTLHPSMVSQARSVPDNAVIEHRVEYRTIHGYRRAFVHAGRGPAILLIHGIGDCCDTWNEIIPGLARHYTVIAPDLLGHGRSDKPRADYSVAAYANGMRDLISVLEIERVTVVGHSLGGGVAMQFAYQYPERCDRLVLVSSGGVCPEVNPVLRLAAIPSADWLLPLMKLTSTRALGHWLFHVLRVIDSDIGVDADDLLRVFDSLPDPATRRAFVRTLRSVIDWRGQAITMLDRCYLTQTMPTLLVWGARDAIIPAEHARIAHAAMPKSRLAIFEDAGHFPFRKQPERFLQTLEQFIAESEPAAYSTAAWRQLLRHGPAVASSAR